MSGRAWAYTGAVLGAAVSIAANVAHSFVPPAGAPAGWRPQPGAVAGSVFWPLAVLVALEILARVAWPAQRRWLAVRWLGLTPVGVVAAVVSYRHLSGLLAFYGEDGLTVAIGPLAVDGLMLLASGALLTGRTQPVTVPAAAPVAAVDGTGPTTAAPPASPSAVAVPAVQAAVQASASASPPRDAGVRTPAPPAPPATTLHSAVPEPVPVGPVEPRRTDEELRAVAEAEIREGRLPAQPSGNALRSVLGIGAVRARRLADDLAG